MIRVCIYIRQMPPLLAAALVCSHRSHVTRHTSNVTRHTSQSHVTTGGSLTWRELETTERHIGHDGVLRVVDEVADGEADGLQRQEMSNI